MSWREDLIQYLIGMLLALGFVVAILWLFFSLFVTSRQEKRREQQEERQALMRSAENELRRQQGLCTFQPIPTEWVTNCLTGVAQKKGTKKH